MTAHRPAMDPNPPRSPSETRSVWFDAVRGLSALAVCAGHLRSVFFCDSAEIQVRAAWHIPFYFATGIGHQAVIVFFVLSGFFVGGSILRSRHNFNWTRYAVARLSRLWVVLIPALIFTHIVDAGIAQLSPDTLTGAYLPRWNSGPAEGLYTSSVTAFLGNIAFLQTILVPVYGSNSPLWSLANEFWYYLIFPLFAVAGLSRSRPAIFASFLTAIALLFALPAEMVINGLIWTFGAVVYRLRDWPWLKKVCHSRTLLTLSLAAFIASLINSKSQTLSHFLPRMVSSDMIIGIAFSALALQIAWSKNASASLLSRPASQLSEISYTLYLFHFPIIIFIGGVILRGRQYQPTLPLLLSYLASLAAVIAMCSLAWWTFERNTPQVRAYVTRILSRPNARAN